MSPYEVGKDNGAEVQWEYGVTLIKHHHKEILESSKLRLATDTKSSIDAESFMDPEGTTDPGAEFPSVRRVAVIGAGVSGLRVAMKLGTEHQVDVFEASDHVGGRLYTYKFPKGNEWDYFDVGAMRFPKTSVMKRTYQLLEELDIPVIEYHMKTEESFLCYNGESVQRSHAEGKDFGARETNGGNVPDEWVQIGVNDLMANVYERWLPGLRTDYRATLETLISRYDKHSTRSLMASEEFPEVIDPVTGRVIFREKRRYPTTVINWLETMTFSVGWFDRAYVETVLEMHAFAEGLPDTDWGCIKDGSARITNAMKTRLETDETFKANVAIRLHHQVDSVTYDRKSGELKVSGHTNPGEFDTQPFDKEGYSHVVLAVSPQVMRFIDLSTCELDYRQRSALLMLSPGPSIKIGIKFKTNWWRTRFGIKGGQSQTDRPVRTVVYPSHGSDEPAGEQSTVLIASYCWTQDAAILGTLMRNDGRYDKDRLKRAVLRDLAAIHGVSIADLDGEYEDLYAFDWAQNPNTMGAYAFFGPGQFSSLYKNLTRSAAGGRLHFAGEAISTCHAWVAGALESAERVVGQIDYNYLENQPATAGQLPHGTGPAGDLPILLPRNLLLRQLAISRYLQRVGLGLTQEE